MILLNKRLESEAKSNWELETAMRRMKLRNSGGRQPRWIWDKKHGKVVRDGKGGIDWYRYQKNILIPKLLPFATQCMKDRPNTVVQEDKAPCHASKHQNMVFMNYRVLRLLWPGNSPDFNMIDQCWPWMKRETTLLEAPRSRSEAEIAWTECWDELSQEQIQSWIERIPRHIEKVIELEGGNEYREERTEDIVRPYNAEDRRMRYLRSKRGPSKKKIIGSI